jgi:hypothetical protein
VRPLAVADAVVVTGDVDHVSLALRRGNRVVRLLVGDDDQAIVTILLIQLADRVTELGARVRLRAVDRVTQCESATGGDLDQRVREAENSHVLADFAQQNCKPVRRIGPLHL